MTFFDIGVPVFALAVTGGFYLYAWNERRKLRADRAREMHPAE